MAVKKSRTGKKKRPQYGPQGTKVNEVPLMTEEQIRSYKNARRANIASIGLLIAAMIMLFVAPNAYEGDIKNAIIVFVAYAFTIVAGGLVLYTKDYVVPERVKMTKITAWLMIGVGIFGIVFTIMSLNVA